MPEPARKVRERRDLNIYEMSKKGYTYKEIGTVHRITKQRAFQIVKRLEKKFSTGAPSHA